MMIDTYRLRSIAYIVKCKFRNTSEVAAVQYDKNIVFDIFICRMPYIRSTRQELKVFFNRIKIYINSLVRLLDRRIADMTINKGKCSKGAALAVCALDYLDSSLKLQAELDAIKSGK